ncbi:MAG: hypothetical protein BJ554DRAFT_5388 [Olpidium bornovanus]|uniref:BPL/LPL catalytic domain-containing protein n=1 Tax=Olpidium bornovanus TaxID=278681 RepID=A0A8H8DL32_9FUNG|nr:MAG: hypothetical protein BJ554DRAFT_5388 [Olpidium bornovanus]
MAAAAAAAASSVPCRALSCGGSAVAAALPFRRARPCASVRRGHLRREREARPHSSCRRVEPLPSPLGWVYLGRVPYRAGLALQETLVKKRLDVRDGHTGDAHFDRDVLLLLEHPPTYTAGKRLKGKVDQCESNRLRNLGADFVEVPRGGQTTYHGPGQLVGYPLLDLPGNKVPDPEMTSGDASPP